MLLSRHGQFGWEATERKYFCRCIGKLEQGLFDRLGERLKGWEVVPMSVLLFDLLPTFLNRVVVRRIDWELEDLKPCRLLGKEGFVPKTPAGGDTGLCPGTARQLARARGQRRDDHAGACAGVQTEGIPGHGLVGYLPLTQSLLSLQSVLAIRPCPGR
jgi:hypothetical protein